MITRHYNFSIGGKVFEGGTHIMGIINATPDSFFADSRVSGEAADLAGTLVREGAEILDIGGQSTHPGAKQISSLEEMSRVVPLVRAIKQAMPKVLLSVDTFYSDVAQQVLDAGADMINDISCLADSGMASLIAQSGAAICLMHNRRNSTISDMLTDKEISLDRAVKKLLSLGVDKSKILLDGGIGFNKSADEDWALLTGYGELMDFFDEYPFLLGTSRKSMFGGEVDGRLTATLDSTRLAQKLGVLFVRVHDVAANAAMLASHAPTQRA